MKTVKILLACLMAILVLSVFAYAEVPKMINYQGKLTTPQGALFNDTLAMTFSIYADSTGGTALWTETQNSVKVEYGVFSVLLGNVNPIPSTVFDGSTRYLGLKVGTDNEMTPRKAIVSVGYAYHSGIADTVHFAMPDADWTIKGDTIYHLNGNVGIGTASPNDQLEIQGNLRLPSTTSTAGIIKVEGDRFIHSYGEGNTFIGKNAGNLTMTGLGNTANGYYALTSNTIGNYNTAYGRSALYYNTTGNLNTANGQGALYLNTTGSYNTADGYFALYSNTDSCNTANGYYALYSNTTGSYNTALGYHADVASGNLTNATAIGANAVVAASNALVLGGTGANAVNVGIGTTNPQVKLEVDSGIVSFPQQSAVSVDNITSFNVPSGTPTKVPYSSESYDRQNEFDPSTDYRFTAAKSGDYLVCASLIAPSSFSFWLHIYKNGASDKGFAYSAVSTIAWGCAVVHLEANDYIEIFTGHSSGSTKTFSAYSGWDWLTINKIN